MSFLCIFRLALLSVVTVMFSLEKRASGSLEAPNLLNEGEYKNLFWILAVQTKKGDKSRV